MIILIKIMKQINEYIELKIKYNEILKNQIQDKLIVKMFFAYKNRGRFLYASYDYHIIYTSDDYINAMNRIELRKSQLTVIEKQLRCMKYAIRYMKYYFNHNY